jgi:hypothetical protein
MQFHGVTDATARIHRGISGGAAAWPLAARAEQNGLMCAAGFSSAAARSSKNGYVTMLRKSRVGDPGPAGWGELGPGEPA